MLNQEALATASHSAEGRLEALKFVQGTIKAPLDRGLVAEQLRDGIRTLGVLDERESEGGSVFLPLGNHLSDGRKSCAVCLLVRDSRAIHLQLDQIVERSPFVFLDLTPRPFEQDPTPVPGQNPHLNTVQAPEPPPADSE
jgi:hypothetical protein